MSARYESRPLGVWNNEAQMLVIPGGPGWTGFQEWLDAGNTPDPDSTVIASPSAEEVAARAELAARTQIRLALLADPAIQALRTWTPAQIEAWIDATLVDLNGARTIVKIIARIVALVARNLDARG